MRRVLSWAPVALGVIFLVLLGYHRREQALGAKNDFPNVLRWRETGWDGGIVFTCGERRADQKVGGRGHGDDVHPSAFLRGYPEAARMAPFSGRLCPVHMPVASQLPLVCGAIYQGVSRTSVSLSDQHPVFGRSDSRAGRGVHAGDSGRSDPAGSRKEGL